MARCGERFARVRDAYCAQVQVEKGEAVLLSRPYGSGARAATTMKIAIVLLSIVAIVLGLVGYTQIFHSVSPVVASCSQYLPNDQSAYQQCVNNASARVAPGAGIGFLLVLAAGLAEFSAWILGLISTVMQRSWIWFVVVLLFTPLGSLLYGVFGPASEPIFGRGRGAEGPGLAVGGF